MGRLYARCSLYAIVTSVSPFPVPERKPRMGPSGNEVARHYSVEIPSFSGSLMAHTPGETVICLGTTTSSVTCHCHQARLSPVAPEGWE